jgi:hypothetical protein
MIVSKNRPLVGVESLTIVGNKPHTPATKDQLLQSTACKDRVSKPTNGVESAAVNASQSKTVNNMTAKSTQATANGSRVVKPTNGAESVAAEISRQAPAVKLTKLPTPANSRAVKRGRADSPVEPPIDKKVCGRDANIVAVEATMDTENVQPQNSGNIAETDNASSISVEAFMDEMELQQEMSTEQHWQTVDSKKGRKTKKENEQRPALSL